MDEIRADIIEKQELLDHIARLTAENERFREAAKLRIADWDSVTQPGAACEDCSDPDDVAALRAALATRDQEDSNG